MEVSQVQPYSGQDFFGSGGLFCIGQCLGRFLENCLTLSIVADKLEVIGQGMTGFSQSSYFGMFGSPLPGDADILDVGGDPLGEHELSFIEQSSKLPILFRVGASINVMNALNHKLVTTGEFSHPPDNNERLNWGGEYSFKDFFFVRGGYNFGYDV